MQEFLNKKIKYLKQFEINKNKWDVCIKNAINGLIYGYSGWLDIAAENMDAIVFGDYDAVMPLLYKKKYGVKYLYIPPFTQQTGIFSKKMIDNKIINKFLNTIPNKFKYLDINFNYLNPLLNLGTDKKTNFILPLNEPYTPLYSNFSENTKRNIKKAKKNELQIVNRISVNDAINAKRENNINNLSEKKLNILNSLVNFALSTDNAKILGVKNKYNKLIAVVVFTFSHNRVYTPLLVSYSEGKEKKAMFLIINAFIKENAGKSIILDFEGSNIEGIARFFKGWGAVNEPYYNFKQNRLPLPFRILKK